MQSLKHGTLRCFAHTNLKHLYRILVAGCALSAGTQHSRLKTSPAILLTHGHARSLHRSTNAHTCLCHSNSLCRCRSVFTVAANPPNALAVYMYTCTQCCLQAYEDPNTLTRTVFTKPVNARDMQPQWTGDWHRLVAVRRPRACASPARSVQTMQPRERSTNDEVITWRFHRQHGTAVQHIPMHHDAFQTLNYACMWH